MLPDHMKKDTDISRKKIRIYREPLFSDLSVGIIQVIITVQLCFAG